MNINEAYRVMQEASGIKVGDKVKVLRKAKNSEMGWGNAWVEEMDKTIGRTFLVIEIEKQAGIQLDLNLCLDFPFFVLEVVEPVKEIKIRFFCDGKDVTDEISDKTKRNLK